jgi:cytochrome c oxidase subunit 2
MFNLIFVVNCDAAEAWQLGLQDPASPAVEGMIFFHDYLFLFLILIGVFVFWMMYQTIIAFSSNNVDGSNLTYVKLSQRFTHSSLLEIVWTILPAIILVILAIPSFALLYSLDELLDPQITLKIVGHQWYWSYEYSDYLTSHSDEGFGFDSYLIGTDDLTIGAFRLLEVDNRVILPINTHIRLLVSAADVLHSWAVPSFGIKVDACPGRLSQASLFLKREGVFYGQCSEICGINHGFMPIVVKSVSISEYLIWLSVKLLEE